MYTGTHFRSDLHLFICYRLFLKQQRFYFETAALNKNEEKAFHFDFNVSLLTFQPRSMVQLIKLRNINTFYGFSDSPSYRKV